MPEFQWNGRTSDGNAVSGTLESNSKRTSNLGVCESTAFDDAFPVLPIADDVAGVEVELLAVSVAG